MKEFKTINGEQFEVKRIESGKLHAMITNHKVNSLYRFYDKPSKTKIDIANEWRLWCAGTDNVFMLSVKSANTFQFTMSALYFTGETDGYRTFKYGTWVNGYIVITKAHNYLYLAKEV